MSFLPFFIASLVAAPFFLLPAIVARANRKRALPVILGINVLIWLAVVTFAYAVFSQGRVDLRMPSLGAGLLLVTWLVTLGFSMRRDAPLNEALDETVRIAPYDPAWPARFEIESARISDTLGVPPGAIEHIGSTAVPTLAAKPIVDMMLGLASYSPARSIVNRLVILGYEDMGEAGVPQRRYLRLRGGSQGGDFNLHLVKLGGEHWTNNLALRELLRSDAGARERYSQAKQAALGSGNGRLLAYSAAKAEPLRALLAQANAR